MALPPDGSLWREQGRPEVYWIRDGERLHIPNPYVMEALNLDWNAVQTVPQGGLDHVPIDLSWAPLGNATPGSVVHVPQDVGFAWNAGKVYWPLPVATTKRMVAWGQEVRTIELRGWIATSGANMDDPDFSYHLELDARWAVERGIDLSGLVKVGNILQLGEPDAGITDGRAWCAKPVIKLEIVGFPPKGQRDRKQPPDWAFVNPDFLLTDTTAGEAFNKPVTWPFDPTKSSPGNVLLADGDYVRLYGSLVSDKRHTGDTPTIIDAVNLWATGLGNNEDDQARWTEVHPPDWIEVLRHAGLPTQTLRGVIVVAPGTYDWRGPIESTLDVDILAPPKPRSDAILRYREFVGPETTAGTMVEGNATRTGAQITPLTGADGIHVHVKVAGARSLSGGSPGKFRALYLLSWDVTATDAGGGEPVHFAAAPGRRPPAPASRTPRHFS